MSENDFKTHFYELILTVTIRDDYTIHGTSVLPRHFIRAFSMLMDANWYKLCICVFCAFKCPKNSMHGLKMSFSVIFRSFPPKKNFSNIFIARKDSSFELQRESLELFLNYLAHFRRYHHLRGFWQSTTSSYRDC